MITSRVYQFPLWLGLAASIVSFLHVQSVDAQEVIEIQGQIHNVTEGSAPEELLEVSLTYVDHDQVVRQADTMADRDGGFSFENLPVTSLPLAFFLEVPYRGVSYTLEGVGDDLMDPLRINVYETSRSLLGLKFLDSNLVLVSADARKRKLGMLSAMRLENSSDTTFIVRPEEAGSNELLVLPIPAQASAVRVEPRDLHIIQTKFGIVVASPVPPGIHELLVTYEVPYDDNSWTFRQPFLIATDTFHLLVPKSLARLEPSGLQLADTATINDVQYDQFTGVDYKAGEDVLINLTGLPERSITDHIFNLISEDGFRRGWVPGFVGVLLLLFVFYALLRRHRLSGRIPDGNQSNIAERIINEVAHLDQEFSQGQVDEKYYRRHRDNLKRRFIDETGGGSYRTASDPDSSTK